MHFQPLEDIAENLEESGTRHPNMALFNRLLNSAPSPTGLMGGALRRTSAQLQRQRHSPGIDQYNSDDEDEDSCKIGKAGSLPSGLGQETQSTVCSFRDEKSARTPLLEIQFGSEQDRPGEQPAIKERKELSRVESKCNEEHQIGEEEGKGESGETTRAPVSLLPPPPKSSREKSSRPYSSIPITSSHPSALLFHPAAHSSLELCSSQPAISHNKAVSTPKPPLGGNKMSFLTVPSFSEPQRFRSVSMGSELTGS